MKMKAIPFFKEHKKLLLSAALASVLLMLLLYFDKIAVLWLRGFIKSIHNNEIYVWLESLDFFVNFISNGATLIIIASLLYLLGKMLNKRSYLLGRILCIGFLSSGIAVQLFKHLIGRARPRLTSELTLIGPSLQLGHDSFPSGHTAVTFCLAYIASQYLPKYRFFFYTLSVIVGLERIEDFSHFPSDVLAGAVLGLVIGKILTSKRSPLSLQYDGNIDEKAKGDISAEPPSNLLYRNIIPLSFTLFFIFIIEDVFEKVRPLDIANLSEPWGLVGLLIVFSGILLRSWAAGLVRRKGFLATTGPYAFMRHPLYVGSFLIALGFCIILNDIENIFLVLIIIPLIYLPMIQQEELTLAKKFRKKWDRYKRRTYILFPRRFPVSLRADWSLAQWVLDREYLMLFTGFFALVAIEFYRWFLL